MVVIVLSCLLGAIIPLSIFKFLNLKEKIILLELKNSELRRESHEKDLVNYRLKEKVTKIQNRNFCIGATFYYPNGFNFKDELVGKRAKIVEIEGDIVKSRLINDNDDFIDDEVWVGNRSSALNYFYESGKSLKFKFI